MSYRLSLSRTAEAYLRRLDRRTQERMAQALRLLSQNPQTTGTKPLKDRQHRRAMRVGLWRIVYFVDESTRTVQVDFIGPRGEVYRDL